jgi:hypothetical protein
MKPWFDAAADLLFCWLAAEEGILAAAASASALASGSGSGSAADAAPPPSSAPPLSADRRSRSPPLHPDEIPVRAAAVSPFATLLPTLGVGAPAVRKTWIRLSALFSSRVKTLPADALRRFQTRAAAAAIEEAAAAAGGEK